MAGYAYHLVDVFTDKKLAGNQLAVLPDAQGLTTEMMQALAREFNLSETAFVTPPEVGGDFRVRIFTPEIEMPFAGHPTIGTAYVLAREGRIAATESAQTSVHFEENIGTIPVTVEWHGGMPHKIMMDQLIPQHGAQFFNHEAIARMLSLRTEQIRRDVPMEVVTSGLPFLYVPLENLEAIQSISFRTDVWEQLLKGTDGPNVYLFTMETLHSDSTVHSRMFAPGLGILEDPATGAACGPLGSYLVKHNLIGDTSQPIINEQGYEMGRPSRIVIQVTRDGSAISRVQVGGQCVAVGSGMLEL